MKLNRRLLTQLEAMLQACDIHVRYERGNFRGGYCLLQEQRLIVINKFYPLEGRINLLLDLLPLAEANIGNLEPDDRRKFKQLLAMSRSPERKPTLFADGAAS